MLLYEQVLHPQGRYHCNTWPDTLQLRRTLLGLKSQGKVLQPMDTVTKDYEYFSSIPSKVYLIRCFENF